MQEPSSELVGKFIAHKRTKANVTQKDFALRNLKDAQYLNKVEKGKKAISYKTTDSFIKSFDTTTREFYIEMGDWLKENKKDSEEKHKDDNKQTNTKSTEQKK